MSEERSVSFDPGSVARKQMLRIAHNLRGEGQVYSAISVLKKLLADYPNTPESQLAILEYASLGDFFERQGMVHTALSMCDWLRSVS